MAVQDEDDDEDINSLLLVRPRTCFWFLSGFVSGCLFRTGSKLNPVISSALFKQQLTCGLISVLCVFLP